MLNRIFRKIVLNKNKELLQKKLEELEQLRKKSSEIAIYGSPTEGNWLGIANASISLFPECSYEFPQWYSHPVFNEMEMSTWISKLNELAFGKITISGFAYFFFDVINSLPPNTNLEVIYHGTWSELHEKEKQLWMKNLFDHTRKGTIKKIGFVKVGMAETVEKLLGFSCFHSPLPTPLIPEGIEKLELDKTNIHIGVFGADTFNKNLHNQVVHALMFDQVVVHVLDKSIFNYLGLNDRIVEHGKNLPREQFLGILGSMDLNLYMSFNESWGLVEFESKELLVKSISTENVNYFNIIRMNLKK